MTGRFREAIQGPGRRQPASAFEPRHRALRCLHAACEFGLTEAGATSGFGDGRGQSKLLFQRIVLLGVLRILHPLFMKIANFGHLISFARWRASSSSCGGVFWVFFTSTRRMIMRRPDAVTTADPKLPQFLIEMLHAVGRQGFKPDLFNQSAQPHQARSHIERKRVDLGIHDPIERLHGPSHDELML